MGHAVNVAKLRKALRVVHLVCSGALGFLVYAPSEATDGTFELVVAVFFFPLITLTGLAMWFAPKFLRRRRQVATRPGT